MTIEATTIRPSLPDAATAPLIHPRWVRVTHWINALAMLMMIGSGWQIYDASPLFRFIYFPRADRARRMARRRAAVAFRGDVAAGDQRHRLRHARHRHRPLPPQAVSDPAARRASAISSPRLRGKLSHDDLSIYNAVQRLLYLGVILAGVVIVLSGLSIWKPVQFK